MRKMDSDLVGSPSSAGECRPNEYSHKMLHLVGSMGVLPTFSYSSSDNRVFITRNRSNNFPPLTHREFELLYHLASHIGQVITREHLLETVWGYDYFGDVRTVDVTIRRLREKIEDTPSRPEYILTRRGVGYYMRNND